MPYSPFPFLGEGKAIHSWQWASTSREHPADRAFRPDSSPMTARSKFFSPTELPKPCANRITPTWPRPWHAIAASNRSRWDTLPPRVSNVAAAKICTFSPRLVRCRVICDQRQRSLPMRSRLRDLAQTPSPIGIGWAAAGLQAIDEPSPLLRARNGHAVCEVKRFQWITLHRANSPEPGSARPILGKRYARPDAPAQFCALA